MKSRELKKAKRDVRRRVLAARDAVDAETRAGHGEAVARRFLSLPEVVVASTVALYWSFGSEMPTGPLIAALHGRGIRVVLPRIVGKDLELRAYVPGDPVTATAFGAMEPAEGEIVEPSRLDVVCVPAVAFDAAGRRVGYGGGFYDRLLPRTPPGSLRAGLAFDLQVVGESLPAGGFDETVDVIVTESRELRAPARDAAS